MLSVIELKLFVLYRIYKQTYKTTMVA